MSGSDRATISDIGSAQSSDTYIRLHREFLDSTGYVLSEVGAMHLSAVDIIVRNKVLENDEQLELLPIDLAFIPSPQSGLYASVSPLSRNLRGLYTPESCKNGRQQTYSCLIVEPVVERRQGDRTVCLRRLWVRPRIRLPECVLSEIWILRIDFIPELRLPPSSIRPSAF